MSMLSETHPTDLRDRLRDTCAVTAEFISDIILQTCRRAPSQSHASKTARMQHLIQSGAWTDAALTLIDMELPQWQVRHLVYDDGEWHCALSRQRELPGWLDEPIETRHADLAMAILTRSSKRNNSIRRRAGRACRPHRSVLMRALNPC